MVKKTASTATVVAPAAPAAVAVPTGIRPTKGRTKGGKGLLSLLAKKGTKAEPAKPAKKARRAMILDAEAQSQFLRVAKAKSLLDMFDSFLKVERPVLDEQFQARFVSTYWAAAFLPENPRVEVLDQGRPVCTGLYSLVKKFHIDALEPEDGEEPADAMIRILVDIIQMDPQKATALVETELDFTPSLTIPLTEMTLSADEETATAANKLGQFLAGEIKLLRTSDGNFCSLLVVKADCKVLEKDGFMDRLPGYCETEEQLKHLLRIVFRPEWHLKSVEVYKGDKAKRDEVLHDMCDEVIAFADQKAQEKKK